MRGSIRTINIQTKARTCVTKYILVSAYYYTILLLKSQALFVVNKSQVILRDPRFTVVAPPVCNHEVNQQVVHKLK